MLAKTAPSSRFTPKTKGLGGIEAVADTAL